jgi:hypothetical protein
MREFPTQETERIEFRRVEYTIDAAKRELQVTFQRDGIKPARGAGEARADKSGNRKEPGTSRALFRLRKDHPTLAICSATSPPRRALCRRTGDTLMPLLYYFPVIVLSGLYKAAADDMAKVNQFWFGRRE